MPPGGYTPQEKTRLEKSLPQGVKLEYNFHTTRYELKIHVPGETRARTIHTVPRRDVAKWKRPNRVLNHAGRHALKRAGLPVIVRYN